uniref:Uncharacterized protein n=1 Tax=Tanacetum cinerariifolium TaxID=118510 RepID=A0A6L2JZE6_TANCI|nr:hypothetical protein [Tanacetum cinerariifolium]
MGEHLSPDCMFDFPMDKPKPHPAYDLFTPGPLPGYASNPNNNNNGWIEADVPLLEELRAEADELMVGLVVDEIAEPIVEMEEQDEEEVWEVNEEWLMAPVTPPLMSVVPLLSTYEVSDAEMTDGITIGEISPRVSVVEGHVQRDEAIVGLSQQVQTLQAVMQQRDVPIQQL